MADDGCLEKEERRMKKLKKQFDRLMFVADADYAYPHFCACGERMVEEVTNEEAPGKRYLTCNAFEGDGLHFRKPWEIAMIEEVGRLQDQLDESRRRQDRLILQHHLLTDIHRELANNAKEIAELKDLVGRLVERMEK